MSKFRFCRMQFGVLGLTLCCFLTSAAQADYTTGFEAPTYTAGSPLTNGFGGGGQAGWYNPVAGSVDFNVNTYAGNPLGFANNPEGGAQFVNNVGAVAPNNIGRGQQPHNFSGGSGVWTVSWDVNGLFTGDPAVAPAVDNLGSFSLQPSATANFFQQLMQWNSSINPVPGSNNLANPVQYNIVYGSAPAAGAAAPTFASPGAAWDNIPVNNWIHQETTWDFASNQILSVSIRNITTGGGTTTVDVSGLGWYLTGGQNNVLAKPLPTDFRIFTGNDRNATGWDNLTIIPEPSSVLVLLGTGLLGVLGRRRVTV